MKYKKIMKGTIKMIERYKIKMKLQATTEYYI